MTTLTITLPSTTPTRVRWLEIRRYYSCLSSGRNEKFPAGTAAAHTFAPGSIFGNNFLDNATWWNFDPRVEWLMGYLTSHRSQKVLVN